MAMVPEYLQGPVPGIFIEVQPPVVSKELDDAMHNAAKQGDAKAIVALLDAGADVNQANEGFGETPLQAQGNISGGDRGIARCGRERERATDGT